jgi:hypothetical protein
MTIPMDDPKKNPIATFSQALTAALKAMVLASCPALLLGSWLVKTWREGKLSAKNEV